MWGKYSTTTRAWLPLSRNRHLLRVVGTKQWAPPPYSILLLPPPFPAIGTPKSLQIQPKQTAGATPVAENPKHAAGICKSVAGSLKTRSGYQNKDALEQQRCTRMSKKSIFSIPPGRFRARILQRIADTPADGEGERIRTYEIVIWAFNNSLLPLVVTFSCSLGFLTAVLAAEL